MTVIDESVRRLPAPSLRPFVESYAGFRQAGVAPARHRGLPSPALTFILTLDDPLVVAAHSDPRQPPGEYATLLGGLHTAPALITHEGRQSGIQLALTPLGARALLGLPAGELANLDVDAAAVLGGFAGELRERIAARETWAGRFGVLDAVLGQRVADLGVARASGFRAPGSGASGSLVRGPGVRPEVGYAWDRLRTAGGAVRISALAAETGWSERYLNARFRAETGLAPKEAARVFRFTAARLRIARAATASGTGGGTGTGTGTGTGGGLWPGGGLALADLAAECGYYDQAHLAREFRSLAGCPPTQWLAEEFRNVQASVSDLGE